MADVSDADKIKRNAAVSEIDQDALKEVQELRKRVERLRKALDEATDIGVYPKSFTTEGGSEAGYAERTQFMVGWNAHSTAALKAAIKILQPGDWEDMD